MPIFCLHNHNETIIRRLTIVQFVTFLILSFIGTLDPDRKRFIKLTMF